MSKSPNNIREKLAKLDAEMQRGELQKTSQADPKHTDFFSDKMEELLTKQIGREAFSSYLYTAMAGYYDNIGLDGFRAFFQNAACEEMKHMKKLHDFMLTAGVSPDLPSQGTVPGDYDSPKAALQASLDHEISITADWVKITDQARTDANAAVEMLGQWYVTEQMEEEDKIIKLIQRLSYGGEGAVLILDGQLREEFED
jgi:ferritin